MNRKANPFSVHSEWRLFLYDHVLLPFERKTTQIRAEKFDAEKVHEECGVIIVRKDTIAELQPLEADYKDSAEEHLVFYSPEAGYKSLFERLRDATAHGGYTIEEADSIRFHHRFGKNGQPESTRLFGRLRFETLVPLVAYINRAHRKKGSTK